MFDKFLKSFFMVILLVIGLFLLFKVTLFLTKVMVLIAIFVIWFYFFKKEKS